MLVFELPQDRDEIEIHADEEGIRSLIKNLTN